MNKNKTLRRNLLPLAALAFLVTPVFAQAQDAIGRVIQTAGVVTAVNTAGMERRIARGSEFFEDETITTGPNGSAQLRLNDGAVIALEVDTFFTVDEYEFDGAGGAADTTIMTMVQGTMRTLTGVIGEDPADTYELNTPFASIGVRGTEYAIVVDTSGQVRVFVFDGSVAVAPATPGGVPTIVGLQGDSDNVAVDENFAVTELTGDDIPPAIQTIINNMDTSPVDQATVDSLPPANIAVQVQRSAEQRAAENQQAATNASRPNAAKGTGNLVDANGNVQTVTTQTELIQARTVVVVSVIKNDPGAFDERTVVSVTPNR